MSRLTIGYRCRVKPTSSWAGIGYGNHECIIQGRSGQEFSVIMLKKGENIPLKRKGGIVLNECSWFSEEKDLELVDRKVSKNITFLDWWMEASEFECPDCGHLCYSRGKPTMVLDEENDWCCPKCGCVIG